MSLLELPPSTLDALSSGAKGLEQKQFAQLIEKAFTLTQSPQPNVSSEESPLYKQVYAAVCSLILEAARRDSSKAEISSILEETQIPAPLAAGFHKLYESNKGGLRATLSRTRSSFPQIVDIEWRLDYYVKSNTIEEVRTPIYFVTLKTRQPDGSIKNIPMSCTLEEIQDLLFRLKDALKQATRERKEE